MHHLIEVNAECHPKKEEKIGAHIRCQSQKQREYLTRQPGSLDAQNGKHMHKYLFAP